MGVVRTALEALTTRGRSFAAAGVTAVACSFLLGERDLLRAGLLVLALPLISALAVSRTRYRLACARRLWPARLPAGHEARADLRLENVSKLPSGLLLVEDKVPYTLGGRARFVLDRIEPHGHRELSYRLRSDVRGRFRVGPLTVRLADPFGLVELARSFSLTDTLTITPRIIDLPPERVLGAWDGDGEHRARALAVTGEDDVAPREYRRGDDLRRVHWRSTARHGELMVRREEQQWQRRATVLLDTRRAAHPEEASFELAVSVAASVGVHLAEEGLALRLVTDAGHDPSVVERPGADAGGELLDAMAVVARSDGESLVPGLAAVRGTGAGRSGGLLVAVLGRITAEEAKALAGVRHGGAVALLVDGDETGAAAPLRGAGWRVLAPTSLADLPAVWTGVAG
ncbi:DUF58 domain-containing protein [Actinocorallia sp. API 0066]|uniref:DUF58 domain-containing protein n=1 Tax=Actinocorallia sp. API 0066 TaxID=2896846 RepID=UPI001E320604|nr:DUF58 domain-containing protein [Actinocorallia sp. API 0066]MCD0450859.1 DUF58 domain-containing protein [Actinocorallia sp. API 0066]